MWAPWRQMNRCRVDTIFQLWNQMHPYLASTWRRSSELSLEFFFFAARSGCLWMHMVFQHQSKYQRPSQDSYQRRPGVPFEWKLDCELYYPIAISYTVEILFLQ